MEKAWGEFDWGNITWSALMGQELLVLVLLKRRHIPSNGLDSGLSQVTTVSRNTAAKFATS